MRMKKRKNNARISVLLAVLALVIVFAVPALAAGSIDTDRDACLHILYQNGDMPLAEAEFSAYPVADVDEYARMTVTDAFAAYPIDLEDIDQDGWQSLAVTLKGYVLRDDVQASVVQKTDEQGRADITVKPGLYLVFAKPVTVEDGDTYFSDPFMVFLPAMDPEENEWVYEENARPKNTDHTTARKVLKIWDDEGYETVRPEKVSVDLLCDGEISETVELSAENDWRYDWGELDPNHEWLVVENVPEGYYAITNRYGKTFTVTNKFVAPVSADEIVIQKRITGEKPPKEVGFLFTLVANEAGNPMPEGAKGNKAEVSIKGAGLVSFGKIEFTKPGVYTYSVQEKAGTQAGWTYDETVFTVTFTVTESEGELSVEKVISVNGEAMEKIEFVNPYKTPEEKLPQTGLLWWPVPVLVLAGLLLIVLGVVRRKEDGYGR